MKNRIGDKGQAEATVISGWSRIWGQLLSLVNGIGILAITTCFARLCIAQETDRRTPEEVINYLSSLRHGLVERVMDDETKALLDEVVNNPSVYAKAITNAMKLRPTAPIDEEDYRQVGTALGLAKRMDDSLFAESVRALIVDTTERLQKLRVKVKPGIAVENEELRREYDRVLLLRGSALDILGDYRNPDAVDTCVQNVIREREYMSGADVVMLRYLEKVAARRPDVRPKLEEMYNSPDSPLRNNPQLHRVLEAMDTADREKHPDKKDAESRPESERNP